MKTVFCDALISARIMSKKFIHERGEFIKYSPKAEETLRYLEEHRPNLTEEYYAFQLKEYRDHTNTHLAHSLVDYVDYLTLKEAMHKGLVNKREIICKVGTALEELFREDIAYWDVHSKNILVKDNKDIKIVDLDSSKIEVDPTRRGNVLYNFLDLLLELYFYDLSSDERGLFLFDFVSKVNLSKVFKSKDAEAIKGISAHDLSIPMFDYESITNTLSDKGQVQYIKRLYL